MKRDGWSGRLVKAVPKFWIVVRLAGLHNTLGRVYPELGI